MYYQTLKNTVNTGTVINNHFLRFMLISRWSIKVKKLCKPGEMTDALTDTHPTVSKALKRELIEYFNDTKA